ncbi:TatD family hydrolase [Sphingobacterium spiritivorum]|uniref:TatD family hydrolase n=1 Tax=Sphingobacterium spiritivorum TaxID=258 RepID=UPI003DA638EE
MSAVYIDIHTHKSETVTSGSAICQIRSIALNNGETVNSACTTAGLQPWYLNDEGSEGALAQLRTLLDNGKLLGIGECGIDKVIETDVNLQKDVFAAQVQLATQYDKPLIIHCVRAFEEVIQTLSSQLFQGKVIFHGYQKNEIMAKQLISKGYYLSFGKAVLNGSMDKVLTETPVDRIFLETDKSPVGIDEIYAYVAGVKQIELTKFKAYIIQNYHSVFE